MILKYSTNDLRVRNYESFTEMISKVMADKTESWLTERFNKYNIPATGVVSPLEALEHPQLIARDMVITVDDTNVGEMKTFGIPIKYSKTQGEIYKGSPKLGESTIKVMEEIGYTNDEIERLIREEVVGIPEK